MPNTGTSYNWRMPLGTDFFKEGWDAIRDLAEDIAATIAGHKSTQDKIITRLSGLAVYGSGYTASFSAISYTYNALVFPTGLFAGPPEVVGSPQDAGSQGVITTHFSSKTTTAATATTRLTANWTGTLPVSFIAFGPSAV